MQGIELNTSQGLFKIKAQLCKYTVKEKGLVERCNGKCVVVLWQWLEFGLNGDWFMNLDFKKKFLF